MEPLRHETAYTGYEPQGAPPYPAGQQKASYDNYHA